MLPNRSYSGDGRRNSAPSRPKKKAPPRPPQPKTVSLQNSKSFQQLSSQSGAGTGFGTDLIDFSAPPCPPLNILKTGDSGGTSSKFRESNEGVYRVGASIFYIKSALENSSYNQSGNPFSPPRPSAQSLTGTPTKIIHSSEGVDSNRATYLSNPTIIRSNEFKGNSNSNTNAHSANNVRPQSASNQENVPLSWDDPPAPRTVTMPTIIKPLVAAKPIITPKPVIPRNIYDEPDGFEDDFSSAPITYPQPEPVEPTVPLEPSSISGNNVSRQTSWTEDVNYPGAFGSSGSYQTEQETVEYSDKEQSYAITLYDYASGVDGDLDLQAGDLVYLIKAIDDNWLYGSCGGAEGLFPANYVNVIVPLPPESQATETEEEIAVVETPLYEYRHFAQVQYQFVAESEKELSLEANETVTILGRINEDWLYGEKNDMKGRFPESFVRPVPIDIPHYNT